MPNSPVCGLATAMLPGRCPREPWPALTLLPSLPCCLLPRPPAATASPPHSPPAAPTHCSPAAALLPAPPPLPGPTAPTLAAPNTASTPVASCRDQRQCAGWVCGFFLVLVGGLPPCGPHGFPFTPFDHFCTRNPVGYWSALHTCQPSDPIFKSYRIRFWPVGRALIVFEYVEP